MILMFNNSNSQNYGNWKFATMTIINNNVDLGQYHAYTTSPKTVVKLLIFITAVFIDELLLR